MGNAAMEQPTEQRYCRRGFLKRMVAAGVAVSPSTSLARSSGVLAQEGAIRRFDHVAVPMQNTEAMIAFYRALGLHVMENAARVSVHFGDQKINFHRPESWQRATSASLRAPAARPPCGDFCFVWEGSAESLMAVLDRAGAEVIASGLRDGGRALGTVRGMSQYVRDPGRQPPGVHDLFLRAGRRLIHAVGIPACLASRASQTRRRPPPNDGGECVSI